jgi:outer membrane protein assembly factor BamB
MQMKTITLLIIALILSSMPIAAQTISEWRADNRTGVSSETGLLKSWPENGPELLWANLELPKGNSSVSFSANSIFLTGLRDSTDMLIALDTTGKIKWQTPIGRAWTESFSESRSTPTVEGNRIYTASGMGDLASVDAKSGEIIWSYKASEIYKGTYGKWGIAESLILDGDKIFFTSGGPETMTIALDKNSGNLIWKSESLDDNPAYVSPILINYSGMRLIINVSASYIFAVNPADGAIVWKFKHLDVNDKLPAGGKTIKCVTPVYHDGKIFVTGGYDHGGMMLELTEGGNNVKLTWTDFTMDVHHGGVVLVNGYIYGANWSNNGDGKWCCLDWNTGKKMYEEHWNCKGSIISAENMLYIYDEKRGNVGLVRATPEKFDLVSSFKITQGSSGPFWAHPVIHNGKLFIRHGNALMAYNIKG